MTALAELLSRRPPPEGSYYNLRGELVPFRRQCPPELLIDGREPNNWQEHLARVDAESPDAIPGGQRKTLAKVVEITRDLGPEIVKRGKAPAVKRRRSRRCPKGHKLTRGVGCKTCLAAERRRGVKRDT